MSRRPLSARLAIAPCLLAAAGMAIAQDVPPQSDFQIDTVPGVNQYEPAIAGQSDGGFVVVWYTEPGADLDGDNTAVLARRFFSDGQPAGAEFLVNTHTRGSQTRPKVACAPSPNCILIWDSLIQDGSLEGVFGQIIDDAGDPVGDELQINQFTSMFQGTAEVAAFPSGFVVVWSSGDNQDGDDLGIFGRAFDNSGRPLADEVQVNSYSTGNQGSPSIAAAPDGGFLVTWMSSNQDGSGFGIFGQLYDRRGFASGTEFQVNDYTVGNQRDQAVASSASSYLVVWDSKQDGSEEGIFAQAYDTAGTPLGGEFQVNSYTTGRQTYPAVSSDGEQGFIVVWTSTDQDGSEQGLFGQRYDARADPIGSEFPVNTDTIGSQHRADVAATNSFVVVWQSRPGPADDRHIYGRLFGKTACVGDCDRNGAVSIAELVRGVNIALARAEVATCEILDQNENGTVSISELVQAVNNALQGCPL